MRGKQRLLAKVPEEETERRQELEQQIQALQEEIQTKQVVEKTRQNAKDSHGLRFLERQRLVRAERSTRKLLDSASTSEEKNRYEAELQRIALDQVYVAHFPHDMKYIPLFRNGVRVVDVNRKLVKRATTRKRIIKNLTHNDHVKWISADQYQRLPKEEWSVKLEQSTFCAPAKGDTAEAEIHDNRFASSTMPQHAALLEAADQAEASLRKEEEEENKKVDDDSSSSDDSNSDSDDSSSDEDKANPLRPQQQGNSAVQQPDEESSGDDFSDSISDEEEVGTILAKPDAHAQSDSSSDDSDNSSVEKEPTAEKKHAPPTETTIDEEFDDFLMPATEDVNVFERAKQDAPHQDYSGDKSKGWATQRQRPGQFKKRRVRR